MLAGRNALLRLSRQPPTLGSRIETIFPTKSGDSLKLTEGDRVTA
jgi:hypothetical protein